MIKIREAIIADAEQICRIQQSVWISTYVSKENNITTEDLTEYTKDWTTPENYKKFQHLIQQPNQVWLVAENDGLVVGHIRFLVRQEYGEIGMLYISQDFQGKGIGGTLLEKAIQGFEQDVIVDVADFNRPAIAFYEKYGFRFLRKEENNAKPLPSGARIGLIRMKRPAYISGPR